MQENKLEINADLDLLSRVALEAGELALRYFGSKQQVWMKDGISPVGEVDLAIDNFLKKKLLTERPNYGWISEESDDPRSAGDFLRSFVVDPIDGTRSFIEGKNCWCISIAIIEDGDPIAGVLECSSKREHFKAQRGKPALLNGKNIAVASKNFRRRKLISCRKSLHHIIMSSFMETVQISIPIPSLAYRLALLSKGDLDAVVISPGCNSWDIAAADILLRQSGGVIMDKARKKVSYFKSTCSSSDFLIAASVSGENVISMLETVLYKRNLSDTIANNQCP